MSRSTGRSKDAREAKEHDNTSRNAEVTLFTRPVDSKLPNSREYHHWAMVFVFDGEDIRTCEGFPDDNKRLYPKYSKTFPEEKGRYYELGDVVMSPLQLLNYARSNSYNDAKYCATWDNCQTWVKELARQIGGEIASNIRNFQTLKEANPPLAIAGKKKDAKGFGSFSSS